MRTVLPTSCGILPARSRLLPLLASLLVAALLGPAGCNIVGPAVILAKGPPKIQAQHELEAERETVIFIDDRDNVLPRRALTQTIAGAAESGLLGRGVIKEDHMISSRSATIASRQDRFGSPLSIVEIGRSVDAERVIYVTFEAFRLSSDQASLTPSATVRLKVIDVESGDRIWPDSFEGESVEISMPRQQGTLPTDRAQRLKMEEALAAYVGRGIAQVFYTHRKTESNIGDDVG